MAHYEVEVKSLLGEQARADAIKARMCELDPECVCIATNTQLNHYFEGGNIDSFFEEVRQLFSEDTQAQLRRVIDFGNEFSIRTRQKNDDVLLVVKASADAGTSANTVSRMEFEEPVGSSLAELDERVMAAGYDYQAKWSREREEYAYKGANVCFDRNAGYGFLAEFEKIVDSDVMLEDARRAIDELMAELGVEELPQDRLARMFDHYNQNWREYYGTDRTFIIE